MAKHSEDKMGDIEKIGFLTLLLIIFASFVLRLPAFVAPHIENDELVYLALAKKVSSNFLDYSLKDVPFAEKFPEWYRDNLFVHPPLFIYFVALIKKIGLSGVEVLLPVFSALLMLWVSYKILLEFGLKDKAMLSISVLSLCPLLFFNSTKILIDAFLAMLIVISFYLLLLAFRKAKIYLYVTAGIFYGLSMLTKYVAIAMIPAFVYMFFKRGGGMNKILKRGFVFSLPAILLFTPWLVYYNKMVGLSRIFNIRITQHYIEAFPFIGGIASRPLYLFPLYLIAVSPVYLFAYLSLLKIIKKWRDAKEYEAVLAIWALSVFALYSFFVLNGTTVFVMRYLVLASFPLSALVALRVEDEKWSKFAIISLSVVGFLSGIYSSYFVPGSGDVYSFIWII